MLKRFLSGRASVFALVFAWKIALFLLTAQPVPANDAFFYDGPVVNFLLHGKYVNPSLALSHPISATAVFSAYPPLYQAVLLLWMAAMGTSVLSAMVFHLALFGVYLLVLLAILNYLKVPAWCARLAGLFLLAITFHDRPDSLAAALGMLSVFCWVRSLKTPAPPAGEATPAALPRSREFWLWAMTLCVLLCFASSFQFGLFFGILAWAGMLAASAAGREPFPLAPMVTMVIVPPVAVAAVGHVFPQLRAGFMENALQTHSFTGFRVPSVEDVLKIIRNVPGVLAVSILLPWTFFRNHAHIEGAARRYLLVTAPVAAAAIAVVGASLVLLTANVVSLAGYFQPLVVCGYLAVLAALGFRPSPLRAQTALFACLALLGSIRAIGMSTWGVRCAVDVGYHAAIGRIDEELGSTKPEATVVLSSAYLYEAAKRVTPRWIHSDYLTRGKQDNPNADRDALLAVRPAKLILTQFDYYRRYEPILTELKNHREPVEFRIVNTARFPAPDSFKSFRRVVQHISWAPVIVTFEWPASTNGVTSGFSPSHLSPALALAPP